MKQLTDEQILQVFADCHKGRLYPQDMVCGPRAKRITEGRAIIAALTAAKQAQPERAPLVPELQGVKGYAMALNEVALKLRKRYEKDLLATPLWAEFETARNKLARNIAAPLQAQPERAPLSDAEIEDLRGEANRGYCIDKVDYFKAFRDAEQAHGIKQGGQQ